MISIYQAANLADAHLIRHLLEEERIEAYIAGEYLQGALGEIPTNTPIEVRVAPEDATRARAIVRAWESTPIDDAAFGENDDGARGENAGNEGARDEDAARLGGDGAPIDARWANAVRWLGGAAIGAGVMWAAYHGPRNESGYDYDGDGKLDERWIYSGDRIERIETDRNRDGRPDQIVRYDVGGLTHRVDVDRDFDGTLEERTEYRKGQPLSTELDRDRDGRAEYRADYIHGAPFREEWMNANGDVVKRIEYERGDPSAGAIDSDGDGRLDTARVYDANGEILRTSPMR